MSVRDITVSDGKYTFRIRPAGEIDVLRHGAPWVVIEQGCNAIGALLYRVEELEDEVAKRGKRADATTPDPREEAFWSAAFCAAFAAMPDSAWLETPDVTVASCAASLADAALAEWRKRFAAKEER